MIRLTSQLRSTVVRTFIAASAVAIAFVAPAEAAPKKDFKVAWSIYVGWMPWGYAADTGIVKKWADKYGITIEVKQFNDYVESVNQYTAGAFDAVTITNMDALSIPAAGGVDTTAVVMGDFSNGNDAVILKGKPDLAAIKGQKVNLVEFSVSHYLLARALETRHLAEKDIKVVNTSDADLAAAYKTPDVTAVVTWNPIVSEIMASPDAKKVFDSSQIPGEIMDLMVVNTAVLKDNPNFARALVGIWYETLARMAGEGADGKAAREAMAKASGTDLAGFDSQLASTRLFDKPSDADAFTRSVAVGTTMDRVRKFLFDKALLGKDAKSADAVGIELGDKTVLGDKANVKLRFEPAYMDEAAKGKL
ncbi:ABC transporter substrate-binding protein [Bradyrhizobium sp. U87765 SZCCT0131]|uniref:putative urea ABC transporter substrate-binding protein n=1 Tax=unclassified Bradyrhizobium TaxID=2631580 RepID=UPI001BA98A42|nr:MULTISPECIES: putative urea ABC transporter substrate-binding protein [unclassified Bradyrhizobium]MBR1222517.1 ABC transporter substrate-binding protein [Bradyrhizobium sp. U87765 SZCCT0131]MBR1265402.1 ABC transporter substrate-binding protein [Bradyrhizobium sp. U87765 SZCCT0134]MBR1302819.1 ABC transporter substrate-binding protein [Bradyrhizobium sp. U87765 SZCCT0110]MBR1323517.1 ABC transporter substrate-binding protein [Bradyrhizobium sp. U87765 SZCCT0109]MBR1346748.1 ABC transporter